MTYGGHGMQGNILHVTGMGLRSKNMHGLDPLLSHYHHYHLACPKLLCFLSPQTLAVRVEYASCCACVTVFYRKELEHELTGI